MPFRYLPPEASELRQGEILGRITDFRVRNPADTVEGGVPLVDQRPHEKVVIVTADCDLLKDYSNRQPPAEAKVAHRVEHILVCDLYTVDELLGVSAATFGSKEMRRIDGNQDERYHRFPEAAVGTITTTLPAMYMDFKRTFGVPAETLYEQIARGQAQRLARVPDVFLQDLTHRFFNFLSRVGPDFD